MKTKDGRDLSVLDITADNYNVPKGEELYVHAKIEVKQFDPKTGKRISYPKVQKFGLKEWNAVVKSGLKKQGYDVEVLHDPVKWKAAHKAEIDAQRAAQAEAAALAQAEAKAKEREALKAELMAEIRAELAAQAEAAAQAQAAPVEAAEKKGPGRPPKTQE